MAIRNIYCLLLLLLCIISFNTSLLTASENCPKIPPQAVKPTLGRLCSDYNELNILIRDGQISKTEARKRLNAKLAEICIEYYLSYGLDYTSEQWVFPLAGYSSNNIEKAKNHGFIKNGYDFFSGNRHGGHPAYDIYIRDKNLDSRDDTSSKPVSVISMTGGIVVASEKLWQKGSALRGGNYLWIYDPGNNLLIYYAHNEELFVEPGTIVRPGDLIATLGRSGFNAAKKRSPTHLHFSVLNIANGRLKPVPVYRNLKRTKNLPA
jgi:hypothetical protein